MYENEKVKIFCHYCSKLVLFYPFFINLNIEIISEEIYVFVMKRLKKIKFSNKSNEKIQLKLKEIMRKEDFYKELISIKEYYKNNYNFEIKF